MTSTGEYLTKLLEAYGVEVLFGIPGVHTVELYRGLSNSTIRHVTPRHEQGAGFMADGYARASGKPGVCFTITGPGMTNIITAMGQAFGDSIPMLVISTVNQHGRMGTGEGWLHELPNQQALVSQVCAFSYTVNRPEELNSVLARAFAVFGSERPRPVHIELPINVMLAPADDLTIPLNIGRLKAPTANEESVRSAISLLNSAETPVVLAGGGSSRAAEEVQSLVETLDAPLITTTNGRGIIPPDHPLNVSFSPTCLSSRALIEEADVVLAVGTELGPTDYDMYEDGGFKIPGKLIRIDIDPKQIMRTRPPELGIVGDSAATLSLISQRLLVRKRDGAVRALRTRENASNELTASVSGDLEILEIIRDTLPGVLIVGDSTQLVYAGNIAFAAAEPASYFNSATGYGTLGYGLPAAIGAKLGAPRRPVVALVGDGGLQFSVSELATAIEAKVPVIMLLHNNNGYGEIKSYMLSQDIPPLGVDIFTPDLMAIGAAYSWKTENIGSIRELAPALQRAIECDEPTIVLFGDEVRRTSQFNA